MAEFLAELRRRHIYRIGAVYVFVAWGIIQVLDVLSQLFALPDWIAQPAVIVLAIGFPVILVAAWMIVGAVDSGDHAQSLKATGTDWLIGGGLIAVLAFLGYQQFAPRTVEVADSAVIERTTASVTDEIVQNIANRLPNSVAVLPFANVSPNPDDAYFAVGIHDEVLNKLQSLQNLSVIARASVMKYADTAMTIPEIADELNVETIMSGSVRLAGDQVLVNAELIDGESNLTVWSDQYPGNLSDIFGIQADIAINIANSLQAQFSVEEQETIEAIPTDFLEAYEAFLKAVAVFESDVFGTAAASERRLVQNYLDEALRFDPEFALANAYKARVYLLSKRFDPVIEGDWLAFSTEMSSLIEAQIEMALALDPDNGLAHSVRAVVLTDQLRFDEARIEANLALEASPNDPEVLFIVSYLERLVGGAPEQAIRIAERALALDPNTAQNYNDLGNHLQFSRLYDEAAEAYQQCLNLNPADTGCSRNLSMVELFRGNREAALEALRKAESGGGTGTLTIVGWGYGLLGLAEDAQRIFDTLQRRTTTEYIDPTRMAKAYFGIGDYEEGLRLLTVAADNPELIKDHNGKTIIRDNDWRDPMLEEQAFLDARRRLGLRQ